MSKIWIWGCLFLVIIVFLQIFGVVYLIHQNDTRMGNVLMMFENNEVIKTSDTPLTYVTMSDHNMDPFLIYMENQGWKWIEYEQMGSRNCFRHDDGVQYFDLHYHYPLAFWVLVE